MNRDLRKPDYDGDQNLEWTAFCYIADEMTGSEKSEFEIRLVDDYQAQQAVVVAMEQSQAIYAALSQASQTIAAPKPVNVASVTAAPTDAGHRIPAYLFAAAASLVLMVAGWGWYANQDNGGAIANTSTDSERLADAWVYSLVALNESEWVEEFEEEPMDLEIEDEFEEGWMFVALTGMEASMEGAE